ncbi:MSMEG_1061 family FMN-dependent PPOX-type flavoprotein [Chengkuizengella sediminis]|uniref:MSMEG_1061 family FMN-dependent PPOX-type flavoprotein n=1 Tax=Chengkuizengella sediminis TaxID=1885917 RepID=UPI00138955AF|nr:MSMEG_1061 family FMN-dependent PPOX-type flavoprotein [Chengkuizengella sediminis]NDI34096.1 pyridoxamine 5'-phosphate oxidase family protein [Chengkuizengella sediminis]
MDHLEIFKEVVTTEEEIREMLGYPSERAIKKVISKLDSHCRHYLSLSPFALLSSSNANGICDVSPRGDAPGFVHIIDDKHIIIPERQGNKRIDSITNILSNPHVGLIFLIPGLKETLRINGKACVIKDQEILQQMAVNERVPLLGIGIQIEECFVQCAKALIRSQLWDQDTWADKESLPSIPHMMAAHVNDSNLTSKKMEESLQESYTKRLY